MMSESDITFKARVSPELADQSNDALGAWD